MFVPVGGGEGLSRQHENNIRVQSPGREAYAPCHQRFKISTEPVSKCSIPHPAFPPERQRHAGAKLLSILVW